MTVTMEIRRIQITGGSSYMITLPKTWAESKGLKKNDPVTIIPQSDGSLLLTTNGDSVEKESVKNLDVDSFDSPEALYRCLIGAYIAGHDQIVLKSDGPIKGAFLEAASEFTQTSMGMEIVEEEEDKIVIKDLIDHSVIVPQKNVRREYLLVKRMIADAFSENRPTVFEISSRDTEVDRIHWLVMRQASIHMKDVYLSSKMGLELGGILTCTGVSKILERMGDHAVLIVRNLQECNLLEEPKFTDCFSKLGGLLVKYVEDSVKAWMDADCGLAEVIIRHKHILLENVESCFKELSDKNAGSLIHGSVVRIADYCTDIAEYAIDAAMEKN